MNETAVAQPAGLDGPRIPVAVRPRLGGLRAGWASVLEVAAY